MNFPGKQSGFAVDVLGHSTNWLFPIIQGMPDNTNFQRWNVIKVFDTGVQPNLIGWFQLKNRGTGMCLMDFGNPGTGGAAVQDFCDTTNQRQLWSMWMWDSAAAGETGGHWVP
jgi:hypothetical protein